MRRVCMVNKTHDMAGSPYVTCIPCCVTRRGWARAASRKRGYPGKPWVKGKRGRPPMAARGE